MPTLKGKWYFKEVIDDVPDLEEVEFHFSNSGYTYETIGLWPTSDNLIGFGMLNGDGHVVYSKEAHWAGTQYRSIDIIGTQEVSEEFYNWFTKNAVNLQPTGTWRFNTCLSYPYSSKLDDCHVETGYQGWPDDYDYENVAFCTANGKDIFRIVADWGDTGLTFYSVDGNEYEAYTHPNWNIETARDITFKDDIECLDPDFAFWFYANAWPYDVKLYSECYIADAISTCKICMEDTNSYTIKELAELIKNSSLSLYDLCSWELTTNSTSYPMITIRNAHPNRTLHCTLYNKNHEIFYEGDLNESSGESIGSSFANVQIPAKSNKSFFIKEIFGSTSSNTIKVQSLRWR